VERKGITKEERDQFSVTYGINRMGALANMDKFDITEQLPQDLMHLFLEGLCVLHTSVLLKHLIYDEKLMSLDLFNAKVKAYKYMYFETKPAPLSMQSLKEYNLNGSQTRG